jgi:DedD protein
MGLLSKFKISFGKTKEQSSKKAVKSGALAADATEVVRQARQKARRRLIGAALLLLIGIIGFPLIFETEPRPVSVDVPIEIPAKDRVAPLATASQRPAQSPAVGSPVPVETSASQQESASIDEEVNEPSLKPDGSALQAVAPVSSAPSKAKEANVAETDPASAGRQESHELSSATPARMDRGAPVADKPKSSLEDKASSENTTTSKKTTERSDRHEKADTVSKPPTGKPSDANAANAHADAKVKTQKSKDTKVADAKVADDAKSVDAKSEEGRFVVQIGAFSEPASARDARAKVELMGLSTYTQVVESSSGRRIRVRVGPFSSKSDADRAAAKIKAGGLPAAVLKL